MSSWNCRHEVNGICQKVAGAYCRPGMKGCILVGKVTFQDGVIPSPVWPPRALGAPGAPGAPGESAAPGESDTPGGPGDVAAQGRPPRPDGPKR